VCAAGRRQAPGVLGNTALMATAVDIDGSLGKQAETLRVEAGASVMHLSV
jgi:hypothetical protein